MRKRRLPEGHSAEIIPMRAPVSTIEALMLGLRWRGTAALREPAVRRRLSELDREQYLACGERLLNPAPHWKAWTEEEVELFARAYREMQKR
jgi:hypothetical protein